MSHKRKCTRNRPILVMIFCGLLVSLAVCQEFPKPSTRPSTGPAPKPSSMPSTTTTPAMQYKVLKRDVYDAPVKTQVTTHLLVSGQITSKGLDTMLQTIFLKEQKSTGFKYYTNPTHVFLYAYTSENNYRSEAGQWIAMLEKVGDDANPNVEVKNDLIPALNAPPEKRFDLSEEKRIRVFQLSVKAEEMATKVAEKTFPLPDPGQPGYSDMVARAQLEKQTALLEKLNEQSKQALARQYGLSRKQLDEISEEAFAKNWPFPSR